MEDLETICRTMLNDAQMDVSINNCPFSVYLTFYVTGTDKKVTFDCTDIASFRLDKDPTDSPLYLVFETEVMGPRKQYPVPLSHFGFSFLPQEDYCWQVTVSEPELLLQIKSLGFAWRVEVLSAEEREWFSRGA